MFTDKTNNREPFTGNPGWKPLRIKCHHALTAFTDILVEDMNDLIFKKFRKKTYSKSSK